MLRISLEIINRGRKFNSKFPHKYIHNFLFIYTWTSFRYTDDEINQVTIKESTSAMQLENITHYYEKQFITSTDILKKLLKMTYLTTLLHTTQSELVESFNKHIYEICDLDTCLCEKSFIGNKAESKKNAGLKELVDTSMSKSYVLEEKFKLETTSNVIDIPMLKTLEGKKQIEMKLQMPVAMKRENKLPPNTINNNSTCYFVIENKLVKWNINQDSPLVPLNRKKMLPLRTTNSANHVLINENNTYYLVSIHNQGNKISTMEVKTGNKKFKKYLEQCHDYTSCETSYKQNAQEKNEKEPTVLLTKEIDNAKSKGNIEDSAKNDSKHQFTINNLPCSNTKSEKNACMDENSIISVKECVKIDSNEQPSKTAEQDNSDKENISHTIRRKSTVKKNTKTQSDVVSSTKRIRKLTSKGESWQLFIKRKRF